MRYRENMVDGATVLPETRPIFPWSLLNCDLSDHPGVLDVAPSLWMRSIVTRTPSINSLSSYP
jgi:hypothetical protein